MFSPLTKRPKPSSRNDRTPRHRAAPSDSPATQNGESAQRDSFISDRPATGSPSPRLSVLASNNGEKGGVLVYQLDQTEVLPSDRAESTDRVNPSAHSVHEDHPANQPDQPACVFLLTAMDPIIIDAPGRLDES
ncbi:hypothetical protein Rs2_21394 [Raphanus sativus]|nr:hypothetical protein Rs2_21394 [Raphanus sativus]